jgi:hypothetical protein
VTTSHDQGRRSSLSDPRVTGPWRNTLSYDCLEDGFCLLWETHVLDGPEGGWRCSWDGTDSPVADESFLIIGVCSGTGAYEGLAHVFQHTSGSFDDQSSFRGVIYEGPPPPIEPGGSVG